MAFPGFDVPMYGFASQGALPWRGNAGGNFSDPGSISAGYSQAYNNALAMNQSNYSNIMAGYQQAIGAQTSAQQAINAGYSNLYNSVMDKLQTQGQSAARRIGDSYSQLLAGSSQQLIDRGLGNTTIQTSVNRGVESDKQRALLENDESISKIMADYMSGLGTQALQAQQGGVDRVSGMGMRQLDFMNSVNAKYPDAGMYGQLAQEAARQKALGAGGGLYGGGAFAGAAPKVGYVPGGGPFYGAGGDSSMGTGGGGGSWLMSQYGAGGGGGGASPYDAYANSWREPAGGGLGMLGNAVAPSSAYQSAYGAGLGAAAPEIESPSYGGGGDF